ncbi:vWA domain-containing protein [Paenibacillus thermotolerans]|uniref:vWA domain-containing protein n=1 Tax=Paenibacillus thermotolerans TaxID=3027807 RepID=UPI00236767E2|nr:MULTISPECIES: vWA domain-containing protein [unclassified Paenibacillus]
MKKLMPMIRRLPAKPYAKIALIVLFVGVMAGGTIALFNHNRQQPALATNRENIGQDSAGRLSGNTAQTDELPKPQRKAYPIGEWSIAIPYINPFGSQTTYKSVDYQFNVSTNFTYVNKDNIETARTTGGEAWQLHVDWQEETVHPYDDLALYMSELGGETYLAGQDERVVHVKDQEGNDWWGYTARNGKGYILTVYKEFRLQHGKTVTFKTSDFKERSIYFMTNNEGHKYQSIQATLAEGEVQLVGQNAFTQGHYKRYINYTRTMYAYKSKNYALNDIPMDTTVPILWRITWNTRSDPKEITFSLDEGDPIAPVRDGERLGALKVKGGTLGRIKVEMDPNVRLDHPELNLKADMTPEGDTLFWLPSGYWNVKFMPEDGKSEASDLTTRLVPVSAGEMTELEIKPLVNSSYIKRAVGDSGGSETQLELLNAAEQGEQAKLSFMLLDSRNPKFTPTISNTEITEGGQPAKILKIERLQTPPSVVLALDSSGSMGKSMGSALASARAFIQGLPDHTSIRLIDFDTEPKLIEGTSKSDVLKNMGGIKANGATALYDSIVQGLELLKDAQRPTLVVFSDGADSNANDTGPGSKAGKQQVMKAVKDSGIPVYTIGFGAGHDSTTLTDLAGMSEGTYYSADDEQALNHVFSAINNRLGNRFEVTYERPKEQAPSDVPVISLTMDVSGSMDVDPSTGHGDFRLDKVKRLFHEFIKQIPDNSLVQLTSFSDKINVDQVMTNRKPELLQALGSLKAAGGTNILRSAELTFQSMEKIPSDKRVIVYLTDAALDVREENKEYFAELLNGIRDEGILVLWVGLGTEDSEAAFQWAAEQSGGKYVISEDPEVLAKAFRDVLDTVRQKPAERVALSLAIKNDAGGEDVREYSINELVDFPALKNSGDKVALQTLSYETGTKIAQYESETAALLYGSDIPSQDVQIYSRLPVHATGKNKAMEWSANEIFFLKRLKGIEAPYGKSYMAVDMEIKNIHADGASYLIPDFAAHFFVTMNNAGSYPASTATWLAETPLSPPGENSIFTKPDETRGGVLVFLVPDEDTKQVSVNFYDTVNGHITLPLVGTPKREDVPLASLPTTATGKLSDTFSMTLKASSDLAQIEKVEFKPKTSVFKVVEAELNSKVQAHLEVNPQERFYLRIKTGAGPFMVPVNTTTALLPYGFLRPVTMGPGSSNKVRFAFQIPNVLKDSPMELYADLFGGGMVLPVKEGEASAGGGGDGFVYEGDGMTLTVNALAKVQSLESRSGSFVIADVTIADTKDGTGVSGFAHSFTLVPDGDVSPEEGPKELGPDPATEDLLLGIDNDWAVFDGTSRRGLLVFAIPTKLADRTWTLQSSQFGTLKLPVSSEAYKEKGLLVNEVSPQVDDDFNTELAVALSKAISRHKAVTEVSALADAVQKVKLDAGNGEYAPAPMPTIQGLLQLDSVKTTDQFHSTMNGLGWLPSSDPYWRYRNSPEAVLTQGWGTEGDLAYLAGGLLAKLGYSPSLRMVNVTDRGRESLREMVGLDKAEVKQLPAWAYTDEEGNAKLFVVPFMKDLSELSGLVYFPAGQEGRAMTPVESRISVYFKAVPLVNRNVTEVTSDITDALGGGGGGGEPAPENIRVLDTKLTLDQLGTAAVDVRAAGAGGLYTAVLENQTIQIPGNSSVDSGKYKIVGIRVEVQLPGSKAVHETALNEGEEIADVFHTLAINLPDLTPEATEALQKAADREYRSISKPNDHSALVWYTRSILYRFIANQSLYESQLADELGVTAGRTDKERVIAVTVRKKDAYSPLRTSIDLAQTANELHRGAEEATHAFRIMSGLFASRLEGAVLPGDKADIVDLWMESPDNTNVFLTLPSSRKDDLKYMEEQGIPAFVTERVRGSSKAIIIPTKPTTMGGEERWAWLEIDPATYETIAVMDTGERGGFAEYLMALEPLTPIGEDYQTFMAGSFIGVSTSVWSVSSFSLMLSDYDKIIEAAKKFTYGLGMVLDGMMNDKDLYGKGEVELGAFKLKLKEANFDNWAQIFEDVKTGKTVGGNFITFKDGFKAGAAYYFKQAEKAKPPKKSDSKDKAK